MSVDLVAPIHAYGVPPEGATCEHPKCSEPALLRARRREAWYCSVPCRTKDQKRIIQLARRETPAQQEYERRLKLLNKYGISEAVWDAMYDLQGGRCAICQADFALVTKVCVDHDHTTGRVRGLLCNVCNQGLGYFADDVARLARAMEYLGSAAVSQLLEATP